jgi:hypothetical protein
LHFQTIFGEKKNNTTTRTVDKKNNFASGHEEKCSPQCLPIETSISRFTTFLGEKQSFIHQRPQYVGLHSGHGVAKATRGDPDLAKGKI